METTGVPNPKLMSLGSTDLHVYGTEGKACGYEEMVAALGVYPSVIFPAGQRKCVGRDGV